jgi:hypothetical protein
MLTDFFHVQVVNTITGTRHDTISEVVTVGQLNQRRLAAGKRIKVHQCTQITTVWDFGVQKSRIWLVLCCYSSSCCCPACALNAMQGW